MRVLAVAVVAGAALHLVVQLPDLKLAGMVYSLVANWKDAAVREVGALMAPRVVGLAATQVNFYFIAIYFASRLGEGAISAVSFAWLIVMTPLGVIGMAISTAAFPTPGRARRQRRRAPGADPANTLRLILFLSLPASAGLMLLAKPLIVVALQRGAFDVASTDLTAHALLFYAFAVFAHSGIEILSRGFYVHEDTRTPVAVAVGSMVLNLCWPRCWWSARPRGARPCSGAVAGDDCEFLMLFYLIARRMPGLVDATLLSAIGAHGAVDGAHGGGGWGRRCWSCGRVSTSPGWGPPSSLGLGGAGALTYLIASLAAGPDEPRQLIARIRHRGAQSTELDRRKPYSKGGRGLGESGRRVHTCIPYLQCASSNV